MNKKYAVVVAIGLLTLSFVNAEETGSSQPSMMREMYMKKMEGQNRGGQAKVRTMSTQGSPAMPNGQMSPLMMPEMTTGDPATDAQLKALNQEMMAKIKVIQEEYATKIKAILGDKKPMMIRAGMMASSTMHDMRKDMHQGMASTTGMRPPHMENRPQDRQHEGRQVPQGMSDQGDDSNEGQQGGMVEFFKGMFGR